MTMKGTLTKFFLAGSLLASACSGDSGKGTTGKDAAPFMDTGLVNEVALPGKDAGLAEAALGEVAGEAAGISAEAAIPSCFGIADDLLADFTADNGLHPVDGRQGGFYVYGDESLAGKFDPPAVKGKPFPIDKTTGNPYCSGPGSFHLKATGWGVWGAALGVDLVPRPSSKSVVESSLSDGGAIVASVDGGGLDAAELDADNSSTTPQGFKGSYDASKYKGISFWARASTPLVGVQVSFPDVYTDGGASFAGLPDMKDPSFTQCLYMPDPKYNCSPYLVKFGTDPDYFPSYITYKIDTTWRRFDVYFADTRQDRYNTGFHAAADPIHQSNLDLKHLTSMAIQVNAIYVNGNPTPNDFEIWVDDVSFIR